MQLTFQTFVSFDSSSLSFSFFLSFKVTISQRSEERKKREERDGEEGGGCKKVSTARGDRERKKEVKKGRKRGREKERMGKRGGEGKREAAV